MLNRRAADVRWIVWSRKVLYEDELLTPAEGIGGISAPNEVFIAT